MLWLLVLMVATYASPLTELTFHILAYICVCWGLLLVCF